MLKFSVSKCLTFMESCLYVSVSVMVSKFSQTSGLCVFQFLFNIHGVFFLY